jgi:hypothetical protein
VSSESALRGLNISDIVGAVAVATAAPAEFVTEGGLRVGEV